MRCSTLRLLGCGALFILVAWGFERPAVIGGDETTPPEPGFRRIFNGKDLSGWHKNPAKIGHGTGGSWTVVDGTITGEQDPPGSGNGGIILSDELFGDFEVIFEANLDWGPDSGFFMRSTDKGQCYQMMLDYHEQGNLGEIYREGLDGASNRTFSFEGIYADAGKQSLKEIKAVPVKPADPNQKSASPLIPLADWPKIWKIGQWNTMRCKVTGNPPTITTWINGTKITEYKSDKAFEGVLRDTGHIAFQVHGGKSWPRGAKVRFRNVQVKELK
jgi:hypothetical protein